jgi:hypothetical protein
VIATLANYGIHAEELGFSDDGQDRLHLSSDWHHFARARRSSLVQGARRGTEGSTLRPESAY